MIINIRYKNRKGGMVDDQIMEKMKNSQVGKPKSAK
jgi:hypothetical protein